MISKILLALLMIFSVRAFGAECTAYEKLHPSYLLSGAHLSTGKCTSCGTCHVPAGSPVWTGTPRTCWTCHTGDLRWNTIKWSTGHLPTPMTTMACDLCHTTLTFTSTITQTTVHRAYPTVRCNQCHLSTYAKYVGNNGYTTDHTRTVTKNGVKITLDRNGVSPIYDCGYCHSSTSPQFND